MYTYVIQFMLYVPIFVNMCFRFIIYCPMCVNMSSDSFRSFQCICVCDPTHQILIDMYECDANEYMIRITR